VIFLSNWSNGIVAQLLILYQADPEIKTLTGL